jgi:hypothetical protein
MSERIITNQALSQHRRCQGQPKHRAPLPFAGRQDWHQHQLGHETTWRGISARIARDYAPGQQRGAGRGSYQKDPGSWEDTPAAGAALEKRPIVTGKG